MAWIEENRDLSREIEYMAASCCQRCEHFESVSYGLGHCRQRDVANEQPGNFTGTNFICKYYSTSGQKNSKTAKEAKICSTTASR